MCPYLTRNTTGKSNKELCIGNRIFKSSRWLCFVLILWIAYPECLFAQKPDTLDFYYRLENKAGKYKITKWMYDAIFTDLDNVSETDTAVYVKPQDKTKNQFLNHKGRPIRNINIVVLDPFGYSVNDTMVKNRQRIEKWGNSYHITTRRYVIRNLLLFKMGEDLDPLAVSESERILRTSPYVNDARIYIKTMPGNRRMGDSVDVLVMVQDKWSTLADSKFDITAPNIRIIERNLFGIGHQLEENFELDRENNNHLGTAGRYTIFNIRKTFITSSVFYSNLKDFSQIGFSLDRPFYSPLAKWAGGLAMNHTEDTYKQEILNEDLEDDEATIIRHDLDYNLEDVWLAKSFPFTEKKTSSISRRSKSFTIGGRYYHQDFLKRPSFEIDSFRLNRDRYMFLANAGFSLRKFYRDRYLYRFGANEDIPEGFLAELTQGLVQRELSSLWYYSGCRVAMGQHYGFGYLSGGVGYGTFYNRTFMGSGVVNADAFYFSNLIKGGRWFFREFTRCQLVHGIDRESHENLMLNGVQMYGFSSEELKAKSRLVLNLEFVMYAPYELIGFKFAPVLLCGFGKTGDGLSSMMDSRLYQAYALGLLIRNEHLISSTFEISFGLYPFVPGNGDYLLKFNPITSYNIRARDYVIAKPELVPYQ